MSGVTVTVQFLSHVRLFVTPWAAACQASLSITNSRRLLKLMSTESVMPSDISSSVVPFSSCPQSFPASGSFPVSQSGDEGVDVSSEGLPRDAVLQRTPWPGDGQSLKARVNGHQGLAGGPALGFS